MHIDEWIVSPSTSDDERKIKEWFEHFRRPAHKINHEWIEAQVITCRYNKTVMRCVGCSRLGDVWLAFNLSLANGYNRRVDVETCSDWKITSTV